MDALTDNQRFHLVVADIATRAAITALAGPLPAAEGPYRPGELRDQGLAALGDAALRRRVMALANAGLGSLQRMEPEALAAQAARVGVPIDADLARAVSTHFTQRADRVLTYRR